MLFGSNGKMQDMNPEQMSAEDHALIMEAAILESTSPEELTAFLENHSEVNAALRDEAVLEKTIVRLDKQAKLSRAQKVSVFTVAKERNDPLFKKLLTVWRLERYLEGTLFKKYHAEGMRRAKASMNKSANSKSKTVRSVANRIKGQLRAANGPAPTELGSIK